MSIEYRSGNADEVRASVKTSRALLAEGAAYVNEVEVTRLEALQNLVPKEQKDALKEAVKEARAVAKTARNRAIRLGVNDVDPEQVRAARVTFLTDWISSLEQEHISHSLTISQREASLDLTGPEAPTDEERKGIASRLAESREALKVIEAAWKVATSEYDSLVKDSE